MKIPGNHYQNLKVDRKATTAEIRKAYRSLASIHHPDRNANSERSVKAMQCINAAYEVLMDSQKRATHDAWISKIECESKESSYQAKPEESKWGSPEPEPEQSTQEHDECWNRYGRYTPFGDEMDSVFATWRNFPTLDAAHRPNNFDQKHLDDFIKYNNVMRKMLTGINLEYVTPDLLYRSFLIEMHRGHGAPKDLKRAYKAINRAMNFDNTDLLSRILGLYFKRSGFAQGVMAACTVCFVLISLGVFAGL